jgi:hypothetical protein
MPLLGIGSGTANDPGKLKKMVQRSFARKSAMSQKLNYQPLHIV